MRENFRISCNFYGERRDFICVKSIASHPVVALMLVLVGIYGTGCTGDHEVAPQRGSTEEVVVPATTTSPSTAQATSTTKDASGDFDIGEPPSARGDYTYFSVIHGLWTEQTDAYRADACEGIDEAGPVPIAIGLLAAWNRDYKETLAELSEEEGFEDFRLVGMDAVAETVDYIDGACDRYR